MTDLVKYPKYFIPEVSKSTASISIDYVILVLIQNV